MKKSPGDEIQIGLAADDWLEHQKYNYFPPTYPKVVKTAEKHFVAISVHFGKVDGELWAWNDSVSEETMERPNDKIQSSESVEQYFDNVCHKFESSMRYWGYCMPELLTSAITDQLSLPKEAKVTIEPTRSLLLLAIRARVGTGHCAQAFQRKVNVFDKWVIIIP